MEYPLEETIRARKSVRSYEKRPLAEEDRAAVEELLAGMQEDSPFPARIMARLLEAKPGTDTRKLGTYGVIRGATSFIGVAVQDVPEGMEAVGYSLERVVLAATARGLGTCWLAGTFNRGQFEQAMGLAPDDVFCIVCPIGYPSGKQSMVNSVFRRASGSDLRKPWAELFFDGTPDTPLTPEQAAGYAFPLEMLRLAPSAANKQPWRILRAGDALHFFRVENPKSTYAYDLPRLDVGIGACHFHLAAQERGLAGHFDRVPDHDVAVPDSWGYLFSWVGRKG